MKNLVFADHSYSLENILNFPFALDTYKRAYPNSEGALAGMQGGRVVDATKRHKELIRKLVNSIGVAEQMRAVAYLEMTGSALLYEPKMIESDHPEELVVPELVVRIPRQEWENPDETLNIIDEMTISFWEHPAIVRVSGWLLKGRFYGYPECCIKAFTDRATGKVTPHKFIKMGERSKGYPCILCDQHEYTPIEEMETLVREHRHTSLDFDTEHETSEDRMTSVLEYLCALQDGKLSTRYNLEDPVC